LEKYHKELLGDSATPSLLLLDSTHIRSTDGSIGVNYGFKEKSKKDLKITILTGVNRVIYFKAVHPDNLPNHICFREMVEKVPSPNSKEVLADRAYA
jgi:hypothetical protein